MAGTAFGAGMTAGLLCIVVALTCLFAISVYSISREGFAQQQHRVAQDLRQISE
jgi:hypothetical protein